MLNPELANTFYYKTKLFCGFKYRYNFNVGDEFVIDSGKEINEDRFGKITNFVDVIAPGKVSCPPAKEQSDDEIDEDELRDTLTELEESKTNSPRE